MYREVLNGDLNKCLYSGVEGNIKTSKQEIESEKRKLDKLQRALIRNIKENDAKRKKDRLSL